MHLDKTGQKLRYSFDSMAELARWIEATPKTWTTDSSTSAMATDNWDLGAGYEGALELSRKGWVEGANRVQRSLKTLSSPQRAPKLRNDFVGHMPHVPRYCAGAPDNMIRKARDGAKAAPVLTLYAQVDALANVNAKYMANFGAAVAQYVRQLEAKGTRVELWGVMVSTGREYISHAWRVKQASQPLDLPTLAFSIGHPAMLRRIGFALLERAACPTVYGYGGVGQVGPQAIAKPVAGAKYLNGMAQADKIARTPEDAVNFIERELERI